jgi:hypothetical protein
MGVGVAKEALTASGSIGTVPLQRTLERAILCFIFGSPEIEAKALKRVKEIIDFALKNKLLKEPESDD